MRLISNTLIGLLLLSTLSTLAKADQIDNIIKMSLNQMKQDPEMQEVFNCLGVSESKFYAVYKKTFRYCFKKYGTDDSADDKMGTCFGNQTAQGLNINISKFAECENEGPQDDTDSVEMDDVDFENMSPEELQEYVKQEQQAGLQELEETMTMIKAMSQGTEDQVTLPIYAQSKIVSHFTNEMDSQKKAGILPAAMFQSSDSIAKIAAFYDTELSNFDKKLYEEDGMVVYMENTPKGFELANDMDSYQKIPHVAIYTVKTPSGSKTMIEIAYSR